MNDGHKEMRIISILAILISIFVFAACGPAAQQNEQSSASEEAVKTRDAAKMVSSDKLEVVREKGGKILIPETTVVWGNPNDPHLTATGTGRIYSAAMTNTILKRDIYNNFSIAPDLAKSWDLSKDGLTYTFKFHEGVKFHNVPPVNGREFTSEDAKYSLLRIIANPSLIVEKWRPRFQRALDFGSIQSIETPDKYTMVVKLKEPYAPFIDAVAFPGSQVLPKEFVEKFPEKIIIEGMIGTGPFLPNEYRNQSIASYKRNPEYWKKDSAGNQLPYLDEFAYQYFADEQTRLAAFRARQLDASPATGEQLKAIQRDEPSVRVLMIPNANITVFRFNTKFKPFQDVRVRKAMHLAVDRHQFAEIIGQGLAVPSGPVTPGYPDLANTMDWLLSQPGYKKDKTQDLEEAKRLMKEAGYGDGLEVGGLFSTSATSGDTIAMLQDQLKPLKITLKGEQVDYAGQWVPKATAGEFELAHMNHAVSTDADSVLSSHLLTNAPRNYGKFTDATLDELILTQRTALSLEERKKWAQEAEKRVLEVVPMIFAYTPTNATIVHPWIHNVGLSSVSGLLAHIPEHAWVEKH